MIIIYDIYADKDVFCCVKNSDKAVAKADCKTRRKRQNGQKLKIHQKRNTNALETYQMFISLVVK